MKKRAYIIGVLFLSLFFGCKSSNLKKSLPFKILTKTYYNWTGGQSGVKGTNVVIKLLNVNLNHFKADSLFFNNKGTKIESHIKKDTLVLMGYFSTSRALLDIEIEPYKINSIKKKSTKIPYILKTNEAVFTYFINGKKKYLKLSDVIKTDNKYYP